MEVHEDVEQMLHEEDLQQHQPRNPDELEDHEDERTLDEGHGRHGH